MTDEPDRPGTTGDEARARRRAEVFGEVLPESTQDDRDPTPPGEGDAEEWLKRQVPPHHG